VTVRNGQGVATATEKTVFGKGGTANARVGEYMRDDDDQLQKMSIPDEKIQKVESRKRVTLDTEDLRKEQGEFLVQCILRRGS
jgi:hypothetical protein